MERLVVPLRRDDSRFVALVDAAADRDRNEVEAALLPFVHALDLQPQLTALLLHRAHSVERRRRRLRAEEPGLLDVHLPSTREAVFMVTVLTESLREPFMARCAHEMRRARRVVRRPGPARRRAASGRAAPR